MRCMTTPPRKTMRRILDRIDAWMDEKAFHIAVTTFLVALSSITIKEFSGDSSTTLKSFFLQNINLLYFALIITISLIVMISFFLFFLRRDFKKNKLQQQITKAFIEAIENSNLDSNLRLKE